jgi:hypothetical protein
MPCANLGKSYLCLLFILTIACGQNEKPAFALRPGYPGAQDFSVVTTESTRRDNGAWDSVQHRMDFTLIPLKRVDSLHTFNLVFLRIEAVRPGTAMIKGEKGGIAVVSTGKPVLLSTALPADSANINEDWFDLMSRVINDTMQVTMNDRGEVRAVKGYEAIRNKIVKQTGKDPRNVGTTLRQYISQEAVTDLMNELFLYLPGAVIKPGDQWVKNITFIQKAPVKYSHLVKVKEIKEDTVDLSVQSVVSSRLGEGKLIVEGELIGTIRASISKGLPRLINLTENSVMHTDSYDVQRKRTVYAKVSQSPARM